jgi:histidinol-phosphate aminotransferase
MNKGLKHLRGTISSISRYVPGKSIDEIAAKYGYESTAILKLGSNENQLGPSRGAIEAVKLASASVHLYPQVEAVSLKKALSEYTGLSEDNLVVSGCGMDGVLDTIMRLFMREGNKAIIPTPTFSYYEIATLANGGKPVFIPRREDFTLDTQRIIQAATDASVVFLCSPNNPSGNQVSEEELRRIVESVDAVVFLDEAYVEFAEKSFINLVCEYDNLVVGRTFSKAFALAGLRLGYAAMSEELREEYMKVATPFSVSRVAELAGIAALQDREHLRATIRMVREGRVQLSRGLRFKTYPSQANFLLANTYPLRASQVAGALFEQGIIIRDCTSFRDAGEYLIRITVGRAEQNQRVIDALNSLL